MTTEAGPDGGPIAADEPFGEVAAVKGGEVPLGGGVEEGESGEAGVVGDEDCVSGDGIGGEAGVLEHAAVEEELKEEGLGAVPGAGAVVGAGPQSMVREEGDDALLRLLPDLEEDGEVVAGGEKVGVEAARKLADVDPAAVALGPIARARTSGASFLREAARSDGGHGGRPGIPREEESEGEEQYREGNGGDSHENVGDDGVVERIEQLGRDRRRHCGVIGCGRTIWKRQDGRVNEGSGGGGGMSGVVSARRSVEERSACGPHELRLLR